MASHTDSKRKVEKPSIVEWFGDHEGYKCGYCKSPDTNYSHGMWAHTMTPQDYEDLVMRGWRRSGKYVYKPVMNQTCCPQYPIFCDAQNFKMSKSHKKIIKAVNRYLITGEKRPETTWNCLASPVSSNSDMCSAQGTDEETSKKKAPPRAGDGPDPTKPPCIKAKEKRRLNKLSKSNVYAEGTSSASSFTQYLKKKVTSEKTLNDLLDEPQNARSLKHTLEIRFVPSQPGSEDFQKYFKGVHEVYKKYQITIHDNPPEKPTERQFTRFLCDSPLQIRYTDDRNSPDLGSYHCHYLIDNKLIAVGVLDILPSSISSVYLFYDPDYKFLSLGTYTALREIAYVRTLQKTRPELKYYNMGFYIHSCPKMRYKGQFQPSFLVCPETYSWVPSMMCFPLLDQTPYTRLCNDKQMKDDNRLVCDDDVRLLYNHEAITLKHYRHLRPSPSSLSDINLYASLIGQKCAQSMLLYRESV